MSCALSQCIKYNKIERFFLSMNLFKKYRLKKTAKHILREASHARHMRGDIASKEDLEALEHAELQFKNTLSTEDESKIELTADKLFEAASKVYPRRNYPKLRENIEIIVVALSVAMAFRTYFIQPFKIPTGSMQPTLFGITYEAQKEPGLLDKVLHKKINRLLFGENYIEVKTTTNGKVYIRSFENKLNIQVGGKNYLVNTNLYLHVAEGQYIKSDTILASGREKSGDHIFVDKLRYNFIRPKRGDIVVFTTDGITDTRVRKDTFYIKRLAGLPGEEVAVHPPYLVINGKRIVEPYGFSRLLNDPRYEGYTLAHKFKTGVLQDLHDSLQLGPDAFLPLGDNTNHSLDGRYFGAVPKQNLVGPAFCIYWPFTDRWGLIK